MNKLIQTAIEQGLNSITSLSFVLISFHYTTDLGGGLIGSIISVNQLAFGFIMGTSLVSIAASHIDSKEDLYNSLNWALSIIVLLTVLAPFYFAVLENLTIAQTLDKVLYLYLFSLSFIMYEITRWILIKITLVGWVIIFGIFRLFILYLLGLADLSSNELIIYYSCLLIIVASIGSTVIYRTKTFVEFRFRLPKMRRVFPYIGMSVAGLFQNSVLFYVVSTFPGAHNLMVFQLLRSVLNPLGIVTQMLDNHLARSTIIGRLISGKVVLIMVAVITLMFVLLSVYSEELLSLLGVEYTLLNSTFLYIILLSVCVQIVTRSFVVQWRTACDHSKMNIYFVTAMLIIILSYFGTYSYMMRIITLLTLSTLPAVGVSLANIIFRCYRQRL